MWNSAEIAIPTKNPSSMRSSYGTGTNPGTVCSGTRQQTSQRVLSRGLLHKDSILDRTTVELWLALLVTNLQDQVQILALLVRLFLHEQQ